MPARRPGDSRRRTARARTRPARSTRSTRRPTTRRTTRRRVTKPTMSERASAAVARVRRGGSRLTTRAVILGLVVCALVLSLAYPVKQYLAQRSDIASLQRDNAEREKAVEDLRERKRQLTDPAYLEAQARKRLQYVMPGDTSYIVVDKSGEEPESQEDQEVTEQPKQTGSWYSRLFDSVERADDGR